MITTITFEWEIHDTREGKPGFRTGTSTMLFTKRFDFKGKMNALIDFANNIPDSEFERNNIDIEEYREYPECRYYYTTKLSRVLKIEETRD